MKLKRCYIENFGGLRQKTFFFQEGITTVLEENGFGKTTLAAFIKAMFFGLPKTTKRSLDENEREKYRPWQGGKYGGFLEFETGGREYRVERFFVSRGGDSFKLYDLQRNSESSDFSQNLGEELFGVDAAAFEKSAYLPQKQVTLGMTGSISARVSHLVEDTDGVNSFETACALLEKSGKRYALKRGEGGLIHETKRAIAQASVQLEECEGCYRQAEELTYRQKALEERLEQLHREAKDAALLAKQQGEYRLQREMWEHYQGLLRKSNEAFSERQAILEGLGGTVPEREEIERAEEWCGRLEFLALAQDTGKENGALEELQIFFGGQVPEREELEQAGRLCGEYAYQQKLWEESRPSVEKEEEWNSLRTFFAPGVPEKKEYDLLLQKGNTGRNRLLLAMGAVMLLSGIFLLLFLNKAVGVSLMALGVLGITGGLFLSRKESALNRRKKELLSRYDGDGTNGLEDGIASFLQKAGRYEQLRPEMEGISQKRVALRQELLAKQRDLEEFFGRYYKDLSLGFPFLADDLKKREMEYRLLTQQRQKETESLAQKEEEYRRLRQNLDGFLKKYREVPGSGKQALARIKSKTEQLSRLQALADDFSRQAEQYRLEKELQKPLAAGEMPAGRAEGEVLRELSRLGDEKGQLEAKRQFLLGQAAPISSLREEIARLDGNLAEYNRRYRLLGETLKLLQQARESLSGGYVKVIQKKFREYIALLDADFPEVSVDQELNISLEQGGERKKYGYFSKGYQNLMEVCLRLALIDAMYGEEKPALILDDPFVNLDDDKLVRAKKLLSRLGQERQIIYFTCHTSRKL